MDDFHSDDFHVDAIHPRRRAPRRRPNLRQLGLVLLIVALMLAAGYGGLEYGVPSNTALAGNATLANLCGQLSLTRRGLPCDIPLPADATFIGRVTVVKATSDADGQDAQSAPIPASNWTFRTRQSLEQISAFYTQGLGAWWLCGGGSGVDWFSMFGGQNPNRPNTAIRIAVIQPGASANLERASPGPFIYQPVTIPSLFTVSLMQSELPFWHACNGS